MNGSSSPISPVEHKDQRAGLIFFGALTIGVGALCAVLVPLLFLAQFLMPASASGLNGRAMATAVISYCAMAVVFIWLGIGSILCRRWARTLLLILTWSWFLSGILMIGIMIWFAQALFPTDTPDPIVWIVMIITAVFGVLLPGAMGLFYQGKHVKATCEARDPAPNWTGQMPLAGAGELLLARFGISLVACLMPDQSGCCTFVRLSGFWNSGRSGFADMFRRRILSGVDELPAEDRRLVGNPGGYGSGQVYPRRSLSPGSTCRNFIGKPATQNRRSCRSASWDYSPAGFWQGPPSSFFPFPRLFALDQEIFQQNRSGSMMTVPAGSASCLFPRSFSHT